VDAADGENMTQYKLRKLIVYLEFLVFVLRQELLEPPEGKAPKKRTRKRKGKK
jgi:hypothetical protein